MPAGGLVVKRRLADAALMEMRLNERKQQNEHNQKKGIVNREIIPQMRRNVYPERRFCGHIAETCTRKGGFGYMWELPEGQQERSCTPDGTHDASSQWASRRWRPASLHCKEACRNS